MKWIERIQSSGDFDTGTIPAIRTPAEKGTGTLVLAIKVPVPFRRRKTDAQSDSVGGVEVIRPPYK